jgi:hypothetical protein
MAEFQNREGRVSNWTARQFVRSYFKDAASDWTADGCCVYDMDALLAKYAKRERRLLGEGATPQKAWMDAARKLETRLLRGEYS